MENENINIINKDITNDNNKELSEEEKQKKELEEKENKEKKKIKFKELTKLKQKILNLTKNEYTEIFKILKKNNQKYSENKNGIMFDFMKISDDTINEIKNFVNYIEENALIVDKDELTKNQYRYLIE